MITEIHIGNIYSRQTQNLRTGEVISVTYQVKKFLPSENEPIESLLIRDAITDSDEQIPYDMAVITSESIPLSRILLFLLGFTQRNTPLAGLDVNSYYELILDGNNTQPCHIILVEDGAQYYLIEFDIKALKYHVVKSISSLDALQNHVWQRTRHYYIPDLSTVNHALLYQESVISWTLMVKDRIENTGPLLKKGIENFLMANDCNCWPLDIDVVIKYGLSCNYFRKEPTFDGLLYTK